MVLGGVDGSMRFACAHARVCNVDTTDLRGFDRTGRWKVGGRRRKREKKREGKKKGLELQWRGGKQSGNRHLHASARRCLLLGGGVVSGKRRGNETSFEMSDQNDEQ